MEQENNYPVEEEVTEIPENPQEKTARRAGSAVGTAGKATKRAGTTMQAAGKTARAAGTGMNVAGKGVKYAGKGVSAAGQGLTKAGTSLSGTGVGALVGVPLAALGAATTAVGKGAEVAGSAVEKAGQATNKAGKSIDNAGKNVRSTGKKLDQTGKDIKNNSSLIGNIKGFNKFKSLKIKLIIIGIAAGLLLIILFLVVMITPLMELGIINIENTGETTVTPSLGYSDINSNSSYWWPIGSSETQTIDGIEYASGDPTATEITCAYGDSCYVGHTGSDIGNAGYGSNYHNVIAVQDGTVTTARDGIAEGRNKNAGYGNYIIIQHSNGNSTVYGHLYINSLKVKVGDTVRQGQVIAKMGNSGNSSGAHLHFEVRSNGSQTNPLNFVSSSNPRPKKQTGNYISGDSNKQSICLTLKANGISNNGVIALMTNINKESGFDYTAYNPDDNGGPSYGLCQWHDGASSKRYTNLRTTFPDTYQTIEGQIDFLIYELDNNFGNLLNNLETGSKSAKDLTYDFCYNFEVPADTRNTCTKRSNEAVNLESYVRNGCQ